MIAKVTSQILSDIFYAENNLLLVEQGSRLPLVDGSFSIRIEKINK